MPEKLWHVLLEEQNLKRMHAWRSSEAGTEEEMECDRELENSYNHYAVAVKTSGVVIGHLPRELS